MLKEKNIKTVPWVLVLTPLAIEFEKIPNLGCDITMIEFQFKKRN